MMLYSTHTWDLVQALESASPASCKTAATSVASIRPNNHTRRNKRFRKKTKLPTNHIVLPQLVSQSKISCFWMFMLFIYSVCVSVTYLHVFFAYSTVLCLYMLPFCSKPVYFCTYVGLYMCPLVCFVNVSV